MGQSVINYNVVPSSKNWSKSTVAVYQLVFILRDELLPHVQRKEEGLALVIMDPLIAGCPGVVGKPSKGFSEFGADYHKSVLNVVAVFVESISPEVMF